MFQADGRADAGQQPHDSRRRHSAHHIPAVHDHARAEKTDAGNELTEHARDVRPVLNGKPQIDKQRRPQTDQDAGTDTHRFTADLAFQPNHKSAAHRQDDAQPKGRIR